VKDIKTTGDFVEAVRAMRACQKEYFKMKSPHAMLAAKKHEALIDAAIEARDARLAREKQPGLSGANP
jgi:hypothetical protein